MGRWRHTGPPGQFSIQKPRPPRDARNLGAILLPREHLRRVCEALGRTGHSWGGVTTGGGGEKFADVAADQILTIVEPNMNPIWAELVMIHTPSG